ncbi:hypothetical protein HHK36_012352 [Tetracentron sinense]|uniref:CTLH domain-containing protein n=1 Tax=Tetracentron sinense TaxID=13715 RepID=A0A835DFG2_TETSI|nr:hypothetical protein HHK36_012352 [Tetracentron sinense]
MSSLSRELEFLVLQFLEEDEFKESVHKLEQESGFYFNMKYFDEKAQAGEWDEVEKYLSGFTNFDDNRYSLKIFFEIRKQKYLEALLDRHLGFNGYDMVGGFNGGDKDVMEVIWIMDLKVFSAFNDDLYKEMVKLLTLENFRENEHLSKYGDTKSARSIMLLELKKLIEANPLFRDKLVFPTLMASRLRTLINQRFRKPPEYFPYLKDSYWCLDWQHQLCENPSPNPDIMTLFTDHRCVSPNGAHAPTSVTIPVAEVAKSTYYTQLGAQGSFPPTAAASNANSLADWMASATASSSVQSAAVAASSVPVPWNQVRVGILAAAYCFARQNHISKNGLFLGKPFALFPVSILKNPRTPPNALGMVDYKSSDHEQLVEHLIFAQPVDEVAYPAPLQQALWSLDDLPRTVACVIHPVFTITSMNFHPSHHTLLLVGSGNGEITLWEIGLRNRLVSKLFKIWDLADCSLPFQDSIVKDPSISINHGTWSPDGNLVGVAFTKHLIHLYAYQGPNDLRQHLEIDAHVGGVNDLAFSNPNKQLCVVTCGDDKLIKVWDLTGRRLYIFEGHEAPVYSVCPHHKENIQFIFSTAIDGKIKGWTYDNLGSRVDYDAPGQCCTTMLYSADGNRLFSCGTSKNGDSFLNRFLAAGDDRKIKFWDMDNVNVLTSTDAGGGLPISGASAVSNISPVISRVEHLDRSPPSRPSAIFVWMSLAYRRQAQCQASDSSVSGSGISTISKTKLNGHQKRITGLAFSTNLNILASSGADALLCIWNTDTWEKRKSVTVQLPAGKVPLGDTRVQFHSDQIQLLVFHETQLAIYDAFKMERILQWVPHSVLSTPISYAAYSCNSQLVYAAFYDGNIGVFDADSLRLRCRIAASAYLSQAVSISQAVYPLIIAAHPHESNQFAVGLTDGSVKVMTTCMPPPPVSTFLAFYPQDNNIIAIGMEDSSIFIYNIRLDEVKTKLKGHQKCITGLAFSTNLNLLASSGEDTSIGDGVANGKWVGDAAALVEEGETTADGGSGRADAAHGRTAVGGVDAEKDGAGGGGKIAIEDGSELVVPLGL